VNLLETGTIGVAWAPVEAKPPHFFFVPKNFSTEADYNNGFRIQEAFVVWQNGLKTDRDELFYDLEKTDLEERIKVFFSKDYDTGFKERYRVKASSSFDIEKRRDQTRFDSNRIYSCLYRPLDIRWLYYDPKLTSRPAEHVMRHMTVPNRALVTGRQGQVMGDTEWDLIACSPGLVDTNLFYRGGNIVLPLYLTDEGLLLSPAYGQNSGKSFAETLRHNFSRGFLQELARRLGTAQENLNDLFQSLTPEDIFHYTYAVFNSPGYRNRYAEFLKIDFPRLPLTGSLDLFRALAQLGGELVALQLLESPLIDTPITTYTGPPHPEVKRVGWANNAVWLDAPPTPRGATAAPRPGTIGFRGVPEDVWNFHIGGYQVCDKWLKDRKGRTLSQEDIAHYQKIVVALNDTIRLMSEIDEVIDQHGGWPDAFVTTSGDAA
jgi:hypothetical protein